MKSKRCSAASELGALNLPLGWKISGLVILLALVAFLIFREPANIPEQAETPPEGAPMVAPPPVVAPPALPSPEARPQQTDAPPTGASESQEVTPEDPHDREEGDPRQDVDAHREGENPGENTPVPEAFTPPPPGVPLHNPDLVPNP